MLKIVDNKIYLTKGDDGVLPVNVTIGDGEPWEIGENDFLTLSVRELPDADSPLLLLAESNIGSNEIIIPSEDTAAMEPGKYSADIQLTDSAGRKYTIWPDVTEIKPDARRSFNNFVLTPEVTK